ncbi:hypothetical protein CEXT_789031 [Caerostris extrusa]|uniref:Ribosomal protein S10 n=1 Tax=Caerostris extrusa TaxID=172846 RepID=A0AAV4MNE1_CAEEX|nr:hypothetical protein CEXT_789031 [Caerostris extrusa]
MDIDLSLPHKANPPPPLKKGNAISISRWSRYNMAIPHANSMIKNKNSQKIVSLFLQRYPPLGKRTHYLQTKKKNTRKYDIRFKVVPYYYQRFRLSTPPLLHENLPSLHDSTGRLRLRSNNLLSFFSLSRSTYAMSWTS